MNRDELNERLAALDEKLIAHGVVDVKFHADYTQSYEKLAVDAITLLEALLEGRTRPMPPIGDSVRDNRLE